MNKDQRNAKSTSGQSEISTLESSCSTKEIESSNQFPKTQKLNTEITDQEHYDADMTTILNGQYSPHQGRIKEAKRKLLEIENDETERHNAGATICR